MQEQQNEQTSDWVKTPFANLVRYVPSGKYYARVRVRGKLIVKSLKTDSITVAKMRLGDLVKQERTAAEARESATMGRMNFDEALAIYSERVRGNPRLKPRTKDYQHERITALKKSWPELSAMDARKISKGDCLSWASRFGATASPSAFNHTLSVLRNLVEIAIESGARYDNPARHVKRMGERPKKLELPEMDQFNEFVLEMEKGGGRFSRQCADFVRFLAFGGFRKTEAGQICWRDCDFGRDKIVVRGDPITGTKNWEIREVPMIPEMRQLLERLRNEAPDAALDEPVTQVRECQKAMDRAAERIAMKRITHHDLRHMFATRCIESGVDVPTFSRWLGHKDGGALAMKVYGHLRNQHSVDMAQKVSFTPKKRNDSTVSGVLNPVSA